MSATTNENHAVFISYPAEKEQQAHANLPGRRKTYLFFKRGFDLLISSLVIIFLLSWLLPLLAILIRLDSRGSVFFVQRRVGYLGKSFSCLKLRTMIVNAVSDHQQAISNDPRITRIGKFLRLTSLDELPQFLNVLVGHMSIVGPRPHMHKDNEDFGKIVSNYRFRLKMKPGITGVAQLKGCRGPAKDFHSIFHRYQWDAFYIRNANFSLDFKIIRLTAVQMIKSIFLFKSEEKKQNSHDLINETPVLVLANQSSKK
ncbi:MAG: sugar transferase [Bacteroidetes bacterium]|nr:sugar transferase [Bacteroidota bacterium]